MGVLKKKIKSKYDKFEDWFAHQRPAIQATISVMYVIVSAIVVLALVHVMKYVVVFVVALIPERAYEFIIFAVFLAITWFIFYKIFKFLKDC